MILRLSLDLPEDLAYVRLTRMLGRALLEHLRAVPVDIDDIELMVGELCANVVRHAQSHAGRFQVALEYHLDHVVLTVVDKGSGFSFKDIPPVGAPRADFGGGVRLGGFGFQLVQSLADRLEFRRSDPQGTTVRAEKRLRYQTPEAAEEAARLDKSEAVADISQGGRS